MHYKIKTVQKVDFNFFPFTSGEFLAPGMQARSPGNCQLTAGVERFIDFQVFQRQERTGLRA